MKRFFGFAGVAITLAMSVGAGQTLAGNWHVDIGLGIPVHGHGHHHHCHPHYYGYYRPYPSVVYVAPPPPPAITYVQPAPVTQYVTPAPQPIVSSPTIRPNPTPSYQGRGVTIRNPQVSGGTVAFVVDEQNEVMLSPGQTKPMNDKGAYVVEFDRGGDYGTARRTVTEGPWKFVATSNGWDLQRDNGEVPSDDIRPVVRRNSLPGVQR